MDNAIVTTAVNQVKAAVAARKMSSGQVAMVRDQFVKAGRGDGVAKIAGQPITAEQAAAIGEELRQYYEILWR